MLVSSFPTDELLLLEQKMNKAILKLEEIVDAKAD